MRKIKYTLRLKFTVVALLIVFLIMSYATWHEIFKLSHIIGAFLSVLFITLIFGFTVSRLIDKPIQRIVNAINKVQEGDLSVRIVYSQNDEMGQLAESFNKMVESLELAKREIEMFHSRQLEKAAKLVSLGEMAAAIAHEIKNPLAGISSAVQVLISDLEDDSKKKIMVEVLNQVKRLDRAVRDLLTFARPKPPSLSYNDVNSVIEKALFFIQQVAKREHTIIETHFNKNLPEIMVDADQLQQVFINLSINAIQAMTEGGNLKVSTELFNHAQSSAGLPDGLSSDFDWITVSFEDTGIGISQDDIDKIFDPFFTKKGKGTGLGLSISQRIIEEHEGKITVASRVGKGSVFSVYLPVKSKNV